MDLRIGMVSSLIMLSLAHIQLLVTTRITRTSVEKIDAQTNIGMIFDSDDKNLTNIGEKYHFLSFSIITMRGKYQKF